MDGADTVHADNSQDAPVRVEDLWFPDRGLVLQAGNRLFRVPGGILAARSPVFRDMLSMPQPEEQSLIDGCPLVLLHDSGADAEYFLRAIFDSGFFERPPAPTTFDIVAGVLRLSTKYDVEYLRRRALLHLSAALPASLVQYDLCTVQSPFDSSDCIFSLLLLVHDLGLTWALPMAMYNVACSGLENIIDGLLFNGTRVHLPQSLLRAVLLGRSALTVSQHHDVFRFLRSLPSADCLTPGDCQFKSRLALNGFTKRDIVNPFEWMKPASWTALRTRVCAPCYLAAETEHRAATQKVWDELPAAFKLDPWEVLNASRSADLE
ncbi:hypothetical protein B0H19DRAFT_1151814 [Mycena capillaripes]|nr:hypothetical protein B0H19DRAFT_1151814 [Mycena capillaripes]